MMEKRKYPVGEYPDLPAPSEKKTIIAWAKTNLFSTWYNSILTIVFVWILATSIPAILNWAIFDADFFTQSRQACTSGGACWGVITQRLDLYLYGFYPAEYLSLIHI